MFTFSARYLQEGIFPSSGRFQIRMLPIPHISRVAESVKTPSTLSEIREKAGNSVTLQAGASSPNPLIPGEKKGEWTTSMGLDGFPKRDDALHS